MKKVYAYDVRINNFRIFQSSEEWKEQMTFEGAKNYLTYYLMEPLKSEFLPAIEVYKEYSYRTGSGKGFFSLIRILFPTITFLGTLYKGADLSKNAVSFMKDYMGKVNSEYKHISDLIYNVYRHGLMHTHMPKVFEIDNKFVGWEITYNDDKHLKISKSSKNINIPISPYRFFRDVIEATEKYIRDFDIPEKNLKLLNDFKDGFGVMFEVFNEPALFRRGCRTGVRYLKNLRENS